VNPKLDTVVIERLSPCLDGGRHPLKRTVGDDLRVEADLFKDGHDVVRALLKWKSADQTGWRETEMRPGDNDRWSGVLPLSTVGLTEYTIEAWGDAFETWRSEFLKKFEAGQRELHSEILEGANLAAAAALRSTAGDDKKYLKNQSEALRSASPEAVREFLHDPVFLSAMRCLPDRSFSTSLNPPMQVWVDRKEADFSAWYEFFPRSAEGLPDRGSTFRDCLGRVDDARAMGFDIIYFPPIHPIGATNRKGRNNSLVCQPGEPGVPYAIGNRHQGVNGGGHKDVAPELGSLEDFDWLVAQIKARGMEVALDFAINCSPDHPYVHEHPEWFFKRPDGSIKYAENPPKKYEDVYPLNFHNPDWQSLWKELKEVVLFWCHRGVKIFRVDNPHTKPVAFWEWLIAEVHAVYPDCLFLSEAFTRPKMMRVLAKVGFTQSYTYFTWRNTKQELTEYFSELTQSEMVEYFRPNLFANTPDILPFFLQEGGRPAFQIRSFLAATLGTNYGIYSGFEICENAALPGREEYADSEKYQFKGRDWNAPGNIKPWLTSLNLARKENRALQQFSRLQFVPTDNDAILAYAKTSVSMDNIMVAVVSLDPFHPRSGFVTLPLSEWGLPMDGSYEMEDLLTAERFLWNGPVNYVGLNPTERPAHLFRLRRWQGRSIGADVYR
jgi:starch synthase (maltosyl-transferring)